MSDDSKNKKTEPANAFESENLITYVLIADDEPDRKANCECKKREGVDPCTAKQFLETKKIKNSENVKIVTELRVDRLTDRHRVVALFRDTTGDSNELVQLPGKPPERIPVHAPIQMSEPINCAQFWRRANMRDQYAEGELNVSGLISELSKRCSPAVVKWAPQSEPGILRIRYA